MHAITRTMLCIVRARLKVASLFPYKNTFIRMSDISLMPEKDRNAGNTKAANDMDAVTIGSPV